MAKSEALDIYTQANKNWNRLMLNGDGNENCWKKIKSLIKNNNNNFARAAHFLVHFFVFVLYD